MLLALQTGRNNEKKSEGIVILPDMLWLRDQRVSGARIVFEKDQLVFEFPSRSIANDRFERCRIGISDVEALIQPPPLNFAEVHLSRSNRTPSFRPIHNSLKPHSEVPEGYDDKQSESGSDCTRFFKRGDSLGDRFPMNNSSTCALHSTK